MPVGPFTATRAAGNTGHISDHNLIGTLMTGASTKGQMLASTANDTWDVLPNGADGTSPVADSTQAMGVRWGNPSDTNAPCFIRGVGSPTTYALRNTVTTSSTRMVIWVGATAPTIGSGYALDNVDLWITA